MTAQSNAILFRAPYGIPGSLSRGAGMAKVIAVAFGATAFGSFGIPAKISAKTVIPIALVNDQVLGFLVRPFPTEGPSPNDPLGTSTPPTVASLSSLPEIANIMISGYMAVVCNAGTPAFGNPVYVRYANGVTATPVGGLEATAVAGSNYAIPGCYWQGDPDSSNNAEIAFNL